MVVFAKDSRQLSYIYSSESHLGEQVLGYVKSIDKKIDVIDITEETLGDTVWIDILDALELTLKKILAIEHPDAPKEFKDGSFDTNGWLKILDKNPLLLQNPIAINGGRAKVIESRADILEFYGVDSAGLEQSPDSGKPDTSSNTGDETFVPKEGV